MTGARRREDSLDDYNPQQSRLHRLLNTTWPAFRAFRVTVRVSWTLVIWPLIFALAFSKHGLTAADAILWGVIWTIAMFTTTWTHEMGHIAMGRRCGIETERITLRALGGLAHLTAPASSPQDDIKIALAGPAVHVLWMAGLYPVVWLLQDAHAHETWFWMLDGFASIQLTWCVFNLLPIYPMDGGSTLRGALSLKLNPSTASWHTATVGFVGNGAFILIGLLAWIGVWDKLDYGLYGIILVGIGLEGIQACRRLRLEAKYGGTYEDADPFAKTLLASQEAVREMDREESKGRAARERPLSPVQDERRRLQETVDRLLDRINEVGGIEKLSAKERRELERASKALADVT